MMQPTEVVPGAAAEPDSGLLARVMRGDPDGWRRLVFLCVPLVLWWCRRGGLGELEAEEAAKDIFQTVSGRLAEFLIKAHAGGFRGWLRDVTAEQVNEFRRRTGQDLPRTHADGDETEVERRLLLRRALLLVREECDGAAWQAAWLASVEGLAPAQAAARLGQDVVEVYAARAAVLHRVRTEVGELTD